MTGPSANAIACSKSWCRSPAQLHHHQRAGAAGGGGRRHGLVLLTPYVANAGQADLVEVFPGRPLITRSLWIAAPEDLLRIKRYQSVWNFIRQLMAQHPDLFHPRAERAGPSRRRAPGCAQMHNKRAPDPLFQRGGFNSIEPSNRRHSTLELRLENDQDFRRRGRGIERRNQGWPDHRRGRLWPVRHSFHAYRGPARQRRGQPDLHQQ